jgi:hypothetical protein
MNRLLMVGASLAALILIGATVLGVQYQMAGHTRMA